MVSRDPILSIGPTIDRPDLPTPAEIMWLNSSVAAPWRHIAGSGGYVASSGENATASVAFLALERCNSVLINLALLRQIRAAERLQHGWSQEAKSVLRCKS
jgi:hypothetical protein